MLLAGHLSCKRKNKRFTNYTAKTTMSRVIYILIVLLWGPSTVSLKEAVAAKLHCLPLIRKAYLEGSTALLHLNEFPINLWQMF